MTRLSCISLFSTGAKSGSFCVKKKKLLVHLSQQNPGRTSGSVHCSRQIFQAIIGHGRNELQNAAGLSLKLHITVAVQDLKISFYKQILVPPRFACSGDGTGSNS